MAMTSCSNYSDELPEVQEKNERVKLSVTAVETTPGTRAIKEGTSFVKGDTIGLFVMKCTKEKKYGSTYYDYIWTPYTTEEECFNVPAVYDGTQWKVLRDIYLTNEYAEIAAYYPYNKDYKFTHTKYSSAGEIDTDTPCDILPQGDNGQPDIMTGIVHQMSVNDSHPEAQIMFSHSLARLTFSLLRTEEFKDGKLTKATLRNPKGFYKSMFLCFSYEGYDHFVGRFTNIDPQIGEPHLINDITLDYPLSADFLFTDERSNIDFLVYPNYYPLGGLQLVLQFGEKEYIIDLPKVSLYSGYQHTFPITLHGDGN